MMRSDRFERTPWFTVLGSAGTPQCPILEIKKKGKGGARRREVINVLSRVRRVGQLVVVTQQLHLEQLADQILTCKTTNVEILRRSSQL